MTLLSYKFFYCKCGNSRMTVIIIGQEKGCLLCLKKNRSVITLLAFYYYVKQGFIKLHSSLFYCTLASFALFDNEVNNCHRLSIKNICRNLIVPKRKTSHCQIFYLFCRNTSQFVPGKRAYNILPKSVYVIKIPNFFCRKILKLSYFYSLNIC